MDFVTVDFTAVGLVSGPSGSVQCRSGRHGQADVHLPVVDFMSLNLGEGDYVCWCYPIASACINAALVNMFNGLVNEVVLVLSYLLYVTQCLRVYQSKLTLSCRGHTVMTSGKKCCG